MTTTTTTRPNLSSIMKAAWTMFKTAAAGTYARFGEALKAAWAAAKAPASDWAFRVSPDSYTGGTVTAVTYIPTGVVRVFLSIEDFAAQVRRQHHTWGIDTDLEYEVVINGDIFGSKSKSLDRMVCAMQDSLIAAYAAI